jgi:hypothetical protein
MRETKKVDDYVLLVCQELKEKYNITVPPKKVRRLIMFFFKRLDEAMRFNYYIYINRYMYFFFNSNRLVKMIKKHKLILSKKEARKKNGYSNNRNNYDSPHKPFWY